MERKRRHPGHLSTIRKGAFISFYQAIRNFSIAIGPVLGGLLANFFGFRSIFIFLVILSSLVIIMIIPLIARFTKELPYMQDPDDTVQRKKVTLMTFIEPLKLLAQKDILLNLLFGGVVYAIWSMVTSSTTGLFKSRFGLSELLLGLAFLPNGFGTIVGSAIVGKLMTRDYKTAEVAYKIAHNLPSWHNLPVKNVPADFPIEHARLRNLPWIAGLFAASTAAYGFSLAKPILTSKPGWIVVPLTLQFLIAATSNAVFRAQPDARVGPVSRQGRQQHGHQQSGAEWRVARMEEKARLEEEKKNVQKA
ncbi:major facilitator superfamily domain-containing protein [Diaporthe sp. PMI_573]|nr:major facilitator superfamily domain-containing protein [Diaporthaceae sp. PMI_573]